MEANLSLKSSTELCDRKGIKIIHSKPYTPSTQGAIERFNKTLKEKLHWYKLQYATTKWIDILDKMVDNYNNSYHNTTNFTPKYLNGNPTDHNLQLARDRIRKIARDRIASEPQKFKVGDRVRISQRVLGNKDRIGGLRLNWTKETYTVKRVIAGNVYALPRYILTDGGSYSPYDIQKIDIDKLQRIQDLDEDDQESDSELPQQPVANTRPSRQSINRNINGIQIGTFAYRLR